MLPKKFRLPGYRVPPVLGGRTIYRSQNLVIKTLVNRLNFSRIGVIVSGRFVRGAAARNRLRRQLLAVIDPETVTPGFDIVVLLKK